MKVKIKEMLYYETSDGRMYYYDGSIYSPAKGGPTITTSGGLITYTSSGTGSEAVLDVGANGTVLMADSTLSTGLKWAAVSGSGGGSYNNRITIDLSGNGDVATIASGVTLAITLSPSADNRVALVVSPGRYIEQLLAPIQIPSWIDLIAMDMLGGPGTTTIGFTGTAFTFIMVSSHNTIAGFEILGGQNLFNVSIGGGSGGMGLDCEDITITNCRFIPHSTTAANYAVYLTAMISSMDAQPLIIKNCEFLPGYSGSAFTYTSGVNVQIQGIHVLIDNCIFNKEENATALKLQGCKGSVKNCTFKNTTTGNNFTAILMEQGVELDIYNCLFDNMLKGVELTTLMGISTKATIDSCIFKNFDYTSGENALVVNGTGTEVDLSYSVYPSDKVSVISGGLLKNNDLKEGDITVKGLSGGLQLACTDTYLQHLRPSGANRNVTLPSGDSFSGMSFKIVHVGVVTYTLDIYRGAVIYDELYMGQSRTYTYDGSSWDITENGCNISEGVAVGRYAQRVDTGVAVGYKSNANGTIGNIAVGEESLAGGSYSIAVGNLANATTDDTIAIGYNANISGTGSVAIGSNANTHSSLHGIGIGADTSVSANGGIALGEGTEVLRPYEIRHSTGSTIRNISNLILYATCKGPNLWFNFFLTTSVPEIHIKITSAIGVELSLIGVDSTYKRALHLNGTGLILNDAINSFPLVVTNLTVTESNFTTTTSVVAEFNVSGSSLYFRVKDVTYLHGSTQWVAYLKFVEYG